MAEEDYHCYLHWLQKAAADWHCVIHAYVLMTNHVHLLLPPETPEGPAKLMQSVGRRYVQYFNRSYKHSGTLWEGRFKSSAVQAEAYFLTCMRYIKLSPVWANMVSDPAHYRWSSYRHNGLGQDDERITLHPLYTSLGLDARTDWVINHTFDLFANLGTTDEQLDFQVVYASALNGFATLDMKTPSDTMRPLFETILSHVAPPVGDTDAPLQLQISALDYSTYTGRLGVGHMRNGRFKPGQDRGKMFSVPGDKLYEGMIIGILSRDNDLIVNPIKCKQLTNVRASGAYEAVRLVPPIDLTLESAVEFIDIDELVEITPKNIRIRKHYLLEHERKKATRTEV